MEAIWVAAEMRAGGAYAHSALAHGHDRGSEDQAAEQAVIWSGLVVVCIHRRFRYAPSIFIAVQTVCAAVDCKRVTQRRRTAIERFGANAMQLMEGKR